MNIKKYQHPEHKWSIKDILIGLTYDSILFGLFWGIFTGIMFLIATGDLIMIILSFLHMTLICYLLLSFLIIIVIIPKTIYENLKYFGN